MLSSSGLFFKKLIFFFSSGRTWEAEDEKAKICLCGASRKETRKVQKAFLNQLLSIKHELLLCKNTTVLLTILFFFNLECELLMRAAIPLHKLTALLQI